MNTQPLGYYGCNCNFTLIQDISETFGEFLEDLSGAETFWLISKASHYYWDNYCKYGESGECDEVVSRFHELDCNQKNCFLIALVNKKESKALGYWGCDYDIPLIDEFLDCFGGLLTGLPESDRFWIISRLGNSLFMLEEGGIGEEAEEIESRLHELPESQIESLIQALANS